MLASSGEMTPPWGVPTGVAVHCPASITPAVEPLPQQLQHPPVRDALLQQAHQLRLVDAPEVVADVRIQHVVAAARPLHAQDFQRLRRAPLRPKPIRRGAEVRLEDRLQHQLRRHLRHSVSDGGNAERPLSAVGLGNVPPQDRLRAIRAVAQRDAELRQKRLDAVLLDLRQRRPIDAGRAAIPFDPPPRLLEDVSPPDPIQQGVKAPFRGPLGRGPEGALQVAYFVEGGAPTGGVGTGPAGHALARALAARLTTAGALPSRRVVRRDDPRYYDPLGRPLRTPRFHRRLIRARLLRPEPRRRASRVPSRLPARVLRPLPRRDLAHVRPRTGVRETWPSPRHDRLGSRIVNLSRLQASRDVVARVLASSVEALDTPLGPRGSRHAPGVCYSALRGLPRRDLHPLETDSVKPALAGWLRHDAPWPSSYTRAAQRGAPAPGTSTPYARNAGLQPRACRLGFGLSLEPVGVRLRNAPARSSLRIATARQPSPGLPGRSSRS